MQKLKILIVDDDTVNAMILKANLVKLNHDVIIAENGKIAVEMFEKKIRIDLVLMDIKMPIMDGFEATKLIKENCGNDFVPVIFITAINFDNDQDSLNKCIESGGDDFLSKDPFPSIQIINAKISAHNRIRQNNIVLNRERSDASIILKNAVKPIVDDRVKYIAIPANKSTVSGDLFLYKKKNNNKGFIAMIGDFTGHGIGAALGSLTTIYIFNTMTEKNSPLSDIIREINQELRKILPIQINCAACFLDMNSDNCLTIWNGGLPEQIWYKENKHVLEKIHGKNPFLRVLSNIIYDVETIQTQPDDRLYIYTDGIIEARNFEGNMFSQKNLEDCITDCACSDGIFERIKNKSNDFHKFNNDDDITLVEIRL